MKHIEAAQQDVVRRYGPAYKEIATCAAMAAWAIFDGLVEEVEVLYRARLDTHADALRDTLEMLRQGGDQAVIEDSLEALLEELKGPR